MAACIRFEPQKQTIIQVFPSIGPSQAVNAAFNAMSNPRDC